MALRSAEEIGETVIARLESEIGPKIETDSVDGGYDCCGCNTYSKILEHAKEIVRDECGGTR